MILFIIGCIFLVIAIIFFGINQGVFGEEYKFNITEQLIEEERQLMLCIDWKIENKSCGQIYGGIDGDNGEPQR